MEMKSNNEPIKLKITGYTWCGPRLGIVSEKQDDAEKVYNVEGIDIIVSDEVDGAIKVAIIDYSASSFSRGFSVTPIYCWRKEKLWI